MTPNTSSWPDDLKELDELWPLGRQLVLPDNATIVVTGAYKGKVMDYMLRVYPQIGRIVGFEPQTWAYGDALIRLHEAHGSAEQVEPEVGPHWELYNFGLLATTLPSNQILPMYAYETDECSLIYKPNSPRHDLQQGNGRFFDLPGVFDRDVIGIDHVDLWIMNMEGYEYIMINWLASQPAYFTIDQVDSFAIQFHEYAAPNDLHAKVLAQLDAYGPRVFDNIPAWGYWIRKDAHASV